MNPPDHIAGLTPDVTDYIRGQTRDVTICARKESSAHA
jgi:hypothetical protein